jgi:hypothetical protein
MTGMSWRPAKGQPGKIECSKHRQVFVIGEHCAFCTPADSDDRDKVTEASALAVEAARRKLPSILDHEQKWNRLARKLERLGDDRNDGMKVKLYDAAIKARRAATAICEWRENWVRIERSERLALGESGPGVDVAPAESPSSEVH